MTAPLPVAVWADHLPLFNVGVIGFVGLIAVGIVWTVARDHRRTERLRAHAARLGWAPTPITKAMPGPVAEAARSRRTKLVVTTEQPYAMWLIWHRWTDTTSADNGQSRPRNLTHYFLRLDSEYPDIEVVRRTGLGGFLMPTRGVGTGDPAFDKKFLVRGPGEHEAARLLTPAIRRAMVDGAVPAWEISAGVLIATYSDEPTQRTLQPRADAMTDLARTLPGSRSPRPDGAEQ